MCGRFVVHLNASQVAHFGVVNPSAIGPRYNVAPSQPVSVVIVERDGHRELRAMRWGLVPAWAADPTIGHRLINARAETVARLPAFRDAFRHRRCLVPASGFYEWQTIPGHRRRQPHLVEVGDGKPFALAGLWEEWTPRGGGEVLETCTVITCEANAMMAQLHGRMPVIIPESAYDAWLNPATPPDALQALLAPFPDAAMRSRPVSFQVNNPRIDDTSCIAPFEPEP